MIGPSVSVAVNTTSAGPRASPSAPKATGRTGTAPGTSDARSRARAAVRLATTTSAGRRPSGSDTMASTRAWPIVPAPMTTTRAPASPPGRLRSASSTAAWENEVVPRAMAVSERTRLPVWTAWRNRSDRTGPATFSRWARSQARRTWPRTSPSPSTAESRPDATSKRWVATSSSKRTVRWASISACDSPDLSASRSWTSVTASWNRSTTA